MRNLLVTLRFDGRAFHGWQVQKNAPTVMQAFQDALESLFRTRPDVKGCSRTDAGVSALEYCVSFRLEHPIPCGRLMRALTPVFRPRSPHRAAGRSRGVSRPLFLRGSGTATGFSTPLCATPSGKGWPFTGRSPSTRSCSTARQRIFWGPMIFPLSAMRAAALKTQGPHRSLKCGVTRTGTLVELTAAGDGFLYNMVRIMAGTLLVWLAGSVPAGSIPEIIESRDRSRRG